jgi:hypothetical protein
VAEEAVAVVATAVVTAVVLAVMAPGDTAADGAAAKRQAVSAAGDGGIGGDSGSSAHWRDGVLGMTDSSCQSSSSRNIALSPSS